MAHSLMLAAPLYGADFVLSCPENDKYHPDPGIFKIASDKAKQEGTSVSIVHDPFKAVRDADVIYTDIWASMGQENESDIRSRVFTSYQVNSEMLDATGKKTYVTHCLPAHRGEEITDDVLDGEFSIAFKEAENRLHSLHEILTSSEIESDMTILTKQTSEFDFDNAYKTIDDIVMKLDITL